MEGDTSKSNRVNRCIWLAITVSLLIVPGWSWSQNTGEGSQYEVSEDSCTGSRSTVDGNFYTRMGNGVGITSLQLWAADMAQNDAVIGDVDPDWPGNEIVTVGDNELVSVIHGDGFGYTGEPVFRDSWFINDVEVGDILPDHPGDEIVVAGRSTRVTLIYKENGSWVAEDIGGDYDWIVSLCLMDLIPNRPGLEVVSGGESSRVVGFWQEDGFWKQEVIWKDRDAITQCVGGELDPLVDGEELYVTGGSFDITQIVGKPGNWSVLTIGTVSTFPNVMIIEDWWPKREGPELCVGGYSQDLTAIYPEKGTGVSNWSSQLIWKGEQTIGSAHLGDVDDTPGLDIMLGSLSGSTIWLSWDDQTSNWTLRNVLWSADPIRGGDMGDADPSHPGDETVWARSSGFLTLSRVDVEGFSVVPVLTRMTIPTDTTVDIPVSTMGFGGYSSLIDLSVEGVMEGWSFSWDRSTVSPGDMSTLTVRANHGTEPISVLVKGSSEGLVTSTALSLSIDPDTSMPASLQDSLSSIPDRSVDINTSGWVKETRVWVRGNPPGTSVEFNPRLALDGSASFTLLMAAESKPGRYMLIFESEGGGQPPLAIPLLILSSQEASFNLSAEQAGDARAGEDFRFLINLTIPPASDLPVRIWTVPGDRVSNLRLDRDTLNPPSSAELVGRLSQNGDSRGNASFTLYGECFGMVVGLSCHVSFLPPPPSPELVIEPSSVSVFAGDTFCTNVTVYGGISTPYQLNWDGPSFFSTKTNGWDLSGNDEVEICFLCNETSPHGQWIINLTAVSLNHTVKGTIEVLVDDPTVEKDKGTEDGLPMRSLNWSIIILALVLLGLLIWMSRARPGPAVNEGRLPGMTGKGGHGYNGTADIRKGVKGHKREKK